MLLAVSHLKVLRKQHLVSNASDQLAPQVALLSLKRRSSQEGAGVLVVSVRSFLLG